MDPYPQLWRDDYAREVDDAVHERRAGSAGAPFSLETDFVLPPAGAYRQLRETQERLAAVMSQLKQARESIEKRHFESANEARRRDQLQNLAIRLHMSLKSAVAELQESRRENEALDQQLSESLAELKAAEARAQGNQEDARSAAQWADKAALEARQAAEKLIALEMKVTQLQAVHADEIAAFRAQAEVQLRLEREAIAAERERIQKQREAEEALSARRQEMRVAQERERQRILAESETALAQAEAALADMAARPAPPPELPNESGESTE